MGNVNTGAEKWHQLLADERGSRELPGVLHDGKILAVGANKGSDSSSLLKLVDAETGQVKHTLGDGQTSLTTLAFSRTTRCWSSRGTR